MHTGFTKANRSNRLHRHQARRLYENLSFNRERNVTHA
jgi:hypothetical protein